MDALKQEIANLRQQGKDEEARQMSVVEAAIEAVSAEATGLDGVKGVIQRAESISASVESGRARTEGIGKELADRIDAMEKEIKEMKDKSKDGRKSDYWKPIMENKGMEHMKAVAESGKDYRIWNQKLKNNMDQIRPKAREILTWLEKIQEAKLTTEEHGKRKRLEVIKEMFDEDLEKQKNSTTMINEGEKLDEEMREKLSDMNRDMWAILQDKTEGTTYDKVNSVSPGEGLYAYVRMHQWYVRTTELGKTNRRIKIMKPEQCKHEWEIAAAVEKWEEQHHALSQEPGEEKLPDAYKITALKCLLMGDIKRHVELKEEDLKTYDQIRTYIMAWAVNKRIEKERGHAPMELGSVETPVLGQRWQDSHDEGWNWPGDMEGENWSEGTLGELDMVGKGKGKYGKAGWQQRMMDSNKSGWTQQQYLASLQQKGKGKGGEKGCFNCGGKGHFARDCQKGKGKGEGYGKAGTLGLFGKAGTKGMNHLKNCYNCGKTGHVARDCLQRQRGNGVNQVEGEEDEQNVDEAKHVSWGGII